MRAKLGSRVVMRKRASHGIVEVARIDGEGIVIGLLTCLMAFDAGFSGRCTV